MDYYEQQRRGLINQADSQLLQNNYSMQQHYMNSHNSYQSAAYYSVPLAHYSPVSGASLAVLGVEFKTIKKHSLLYYLLVKKRKFIEKRNPFEGKIDGDN
jgi:hypothetical protein